MRQSRFVADLTTCSATTLFFVSVLSSIGLGLHHGSDAESEPGSHPSSSPFENPERYPVARYAIAHGKVSAASVLLILCDFSGFNGLPSQPMHSDTSHAQSAGITADDYARCEGFLEAAYLEFKPPSCQSKIKARLQWYTTCCYRVGRLRRE